MNIKPILARAIPYLRNRYVLAALISGFWMLFFDHYDLRSQLKMQKKIDVLQEKKEYYTNEILKLKAEKELIKNNPERVEKFAREQYFMKRDNEDVYVVPVTESK